MRGRSFRLGLIVLVLGGCLAVVASVSGGLASNGSGTLEFSLKPEVLTSSGNGFAVATFTAASGTAAHVTITIDLPSALLHPAATSSGCSGPVLVHGGAANRFTCKVGTVHKGQTVKRFVTFRGSAPGTYTATASVSYGDAHTIGPKTAQTTVFAAADANRAGNCFFHGGGSVSTPPVTATNQQRTAIDFGHAAPSLGLPCTWAFVGEDPPRSGSRTEISFVSVPELAAPATVTIDFRSLPVPFSHFRLRYLPNYPASLASVEIAACHHGQLPPHAEVCLLSVVPKGHGATATLLQLGNGGDPGYDGG